MDYWRTFRIKISYCDMHNRKRYIWRHQRNLMCTMIYFVDNECFKVLKVLSNDFFENI